MERSNNSGESGRDRSEEPDPPRSVNEREGTAVVGSAASTNEEIDIDDVNVSSLALENALDSTSSMEIGNYNLCSSSSDPVAIISQLEQMEVDDHKDQRGPGPSTGSQSQSQLSDGNSSNSLSNDSTEGASLASIPHAPLRGSQSDTRLWVPFKTVAEDHRQLPASVMELFTAQFLDKSISRIGYVITLANICMIEAGFVPVRDENDPVVISADALMLESLPVRMNRCVDVLTSIFKAKHSLANVFYRFVIQVDPQNAEPGSDHYEFGNYLLKLSVWHNADTFISLVGGNESVEYKLGILSKYISGLTNFQRLSLPNMMRRFDNMKFITDVRFEICDHFIDRLGSVSADVIGFSVLPNEILEHFAQFLDLRSFLSLIGSCRRMYVVLNTEAFWKTLCERIPSDFTLYDLPAPTTQSLRARIDAPGSTYKEKYRVFYNEALAEFRRRNRNRVQFRHFPLYPYF